MDFKIYNGIVYLKMYGTYVKTGVQLDNVLTYRDLVQANPEMKDRIDEHLADPVKSKKFLATIERKTTFLSTFFKYKNLNVKFSNYYICNDRGEAVTGNFSESLALQLRAGVFEESAFEFLSKLVKAGINRDVTLNTLAKNYDVTTKKTHFLVPVTSEINSQLFHCPVVRKSLNYPVTAFCQSEVLASSALKAYRVICDPKDLDINLDRNFKPSISISNGYVLGLDRNIMERLHTSTVLSTRIRSLLSNQEPFVSDCPVEELPPSCFWGMEP